MAVVAGRSCLAEQHNECEVDADGDVDGRGNVVVHVDVGAGGVGHGVGDVVDGNEAGDVRIMLVSVATSDTASLTPPPPTST